MVTTLAEFMSAVEAELGLNVGTQASPGPERALTLRWLNEGYEDFVRRTHCKVTWDDVPLTVGESRYDLPSQTVAVLQMANSAGRGLERVTLQEIDDLHRADSTASTTITRYATAGHTYFRIWPTPTTADTLTMTYVPRPTPMSDDVHSPTDVPAEFHQAVEFYAEARAARYDNHGPSQFGGTYLMLYEQAIAQCKAAAKDKGGSRMARIIPGRMGSREAILSDRSVW